MVSLLAMPDSEVQSPPPRFRLGVWTGAGVLDQRPRLGDTEAFRIATPGAVLSLQLAPWWELPGPRALVVLPYARYESSMRATAEHVGGDQRVRSTLAILGVDLQARLRRTPVGVWLGGGVRGFYDGVQAIGAGPVRGRGAGGVVVRPAATLRPTRRLQMLVGAAAGLAVADPRLPRGSATRVGVRAGADLELRVGLTHRWSVFARYVEAHTIWPSGGRQHHRSAIAGLGLIAGSRRARRQQPAPERRRSTGARPRAPERAAEPAKALKGKTLAGEDFDLHALRGSIVVVDFWASWCAPCRAAMPGLERLAARHDGGVVVVGVSVDESRAEAEQFATATAVSFPLVWDEGQRIADDWRPPKMPTTYVIAPDGTIAATFAGYSREEQALLVELVDGLVASAQRE
ncbi:MAG: TlpA disulfide reductase family protein [Myxococcota bacterium]